ncbi:DNA polymerase I [Oxalobacter aliiformigenes]|uniref:DNA polymerase I n=1 Tax=Oxalobacter aliiformigenes TaxID=2946593 RepID=UPI0022B052CD|nr:DNA polymerase I [Oxalobacter aliiformigenes]MCZ4064853.1 DNA polymerase I [Oxalobacter aliiformigenes]WAV98964.1 DNA polymerase I [Oxalobacter aliiformigenes]
MNKLLLLVDGSSYLYRAYHALPDLRNAEGEPTGAIYGFLNMLHRLQKDYPTAYVACIFDAKGKTFRNDLYQEYKANRSAMPDDLVKQTAPIHELVRMLGWPVLSVEGIEADDVIGTLVTIAGKEGFDIVVSTGDKDMSQLVKDHVMLVNTMNNEVMDTEGVIRKFGVPPERIIDYLSLIGDTSDNIPGVSKVGPKTAVKWLAQYGSLDGVIENAGMIKGTAGDNLRKSLDWLPQARKLITIRTDCDLSGQFKSINETLVKKPEDIAGLRKAYERYGFKSWLRELNATSQEKNDDKNQFGLFNEPAFQQGEFVGKQKYETVLTEKQLDNWLRKIDRAELTSLDTETTSLDSMKARLVGISLSVEPGFAAYIPLAHHTIEPVEQLPVDYVLGELKNWLENPCKKKVGQNLKYDSHIFANYDIHLQGIEHDTLLESYVLESHRRHDMDSLSERLLEHKPISYEKICGKGASQIGFDQIELDCATEYAAEDADVTLQLHKKMWPQIEKNEGLRFIYEKIEMPTLVVLQKMERNGVLIDPERLLRQSSELGTKMDELEKSAYRAAEQTFNLNSPKQLAEILFDKLGLPMIKKTPSGAPSTSEEVLEKLSLDYPLPKIILDYRGMSKLKSTYTDKLPRMINAETGRVHTNYAQAVAVTGRLASSDPNLQNIPVKTEEGRRIREAFIAPAESYIVSADYSQIELRIMAHLSEDSSLLKAFHDGQDVHRATASELFDITPLEVNPEQRRYAKVINFGLIYGMSAFGVASNLGISRTDAKNYIDRYFQRYPGVAQYMDNIRATAREQGYVETVFGRRLWLPEINSPNGPRRQAAERAAINAPMQGTAADIIKLSMIEVENWLENEQLESKLIMQVHDELVLEVPDKELDIVRKKLPELMGSVARLKVPLIAEVGFGKNWDEAH